MTDLSAESIAAMCAGKHPYPDAATARKVAAKPQRRARQEGHIDVFRCPVCGFWHLGIKRGR